MKLRDFHLSLEGKVAVVTGAGRGLGKAMAKALAGAGADVVCAGRTLGDLEATAQDIRLLGQNALAWPTDITNNNAVNELVHRTIETMGHVDILVNNAGILIEKRFLEMEDDEWQRIWETNFLGAVYCTRAFGQHMVSQQSGKVINVSSSWGLKGVAKHTAYTASKAALMALTRSLAVEWIRYGVMVNCLAPGYFDTDIPASALANPTLKDKILRSIPARRIGDPDELGALVVFLASKASDYMTGAIIVMDGGLSVQ